MYDLGRLMKYRQRVNLLTAKFIIHDASICESINHSHSRTLRDASRGGRMHDYGKNRACNIVSHKIHLYANPRLILGLHFRSYMQLLLYRRL